MTRPEEMLPSCEAAEDVSIEHSVTAHEDVLSVQMIAAAGDTVLRQTHCGLSVKPSDHRDDLQACHPIDIAMTGSGAEWRVSWRMRGGLVSYPHELSVARDTAAAIREVALGIVNDARDGEVRLSVFGSDGSVQDVFTGRYELSRWSVASSRLPLPVRSRWREQETARRQALRAYCRLRDLLAEAAGGGLIRRGVARTLREQIRSELLREEG
jgi:hypothetical protein